jgi:acyl-CoA synthetase (AMP-forming)/AMP-acid ligase II
MQVETAAVVDAGDALPLTFGALARDRARRYGDKVLLACEEGRLTYAEAEARSRRLARALLAQGVAKGTHVGLLMPNGPDFLVAVLAVTRIGAVVLPYSTLSTPDELRWLLANSDPGVLLAASRFRSRRYDEDLKAALPGLDFSRPPPLRSAGAPWLQQIFFYGAPPEGCDPAWTAAALEASAEPVDEAWLEAVEARVTPADRAVIIHTSGSTGTPKGVMHAHGVLIRHRSNLNRVRGYGEDDVLFSPAPWFWVTGFSNALLGTLIAGARVALSNSLVASEVLDLLERERPTLTNGYPPTAARLAADPSFPARDLSSIRRGNLYSLMSPELRPADPGLRHEQYGMSEAGSAITTLSDESDLPERLRGSNGPFAPGFETRVVDPATGADVEPGQPGELWLRGPFMMQGYYGKPRSEAFDAEGWYHTGDIGRINEDGFFFLQGRLNGMIKTALANVSPREVEAVLRGLTGDLPCVVLGVPDPERGQAVAAVLTTDDPAELDEAALKRGVAEKLSSFKVPRRILRFASAEMPMLSSGKIDMRRLAEMVQARWAG